MQFSLKWHRGRPSVWDENLWSELHFCTSTIGGSTLTCAISFAPAHHRSPHSLTSKKTVLNGPIRNLYMSNYTFTPNLNLHLNQTHTFTHRHCSQIESLKIRIFCRSCKAVTAITDRRKANKRFQLTHIHCTATVLSAVSRIIFICVYFTHSLTLTHTITSLSTFRTNWAADPSHTREFTY